MNKYNTECIVLKRTMYGDSDKIYTLLSKDKGKIHALAKGVRKITSRRGGNLDTGNHILVGITENSTGFKLITEVSTINSFDSVKQSSKMSPKAFYILELINRFLDEGEITQNIFDITLKGLSDLNLSENAVSLFEVSLLRSLGYELMLDKCAHCGKKVSAEWQTPKFNYDLGGVICGICDGNGIGIKRETIGFLKYISLGKNIFYSKEGEDIIRHFVKDVLGEKIKTVEIFDKV